MFDPTANPDSYVVVPTALRGAPTDSVIHGAPFSVGRPGPSRDENGKPVRRVVTISDGWRQEVRLTFFEKDVAEDFVAVLNHGHNLRREHGK